MRKILSFALALALALTILSGSVAAEDAKWPERELTGTTVELRDPFLNDKHMREQSFAGPGREYALSGAFLTRRVNKATALLREGDYVLVDMDYANSKRVVYFETNSLVAADVAEEKLEGYSGKTKETVYPVYYGPGKEYDIVTQRATSRFAVFTLAELLKLFNGNLARAQRAQRDAIHWVGLDAGTPVAVFFETDGWVYVETAQCSIGAARFWIPASAVE